MKLIKLSGINCLYAFVDDEDYDLVKNYKWHATKDGYTFYAHGHTPTPVKRLSMHRVIMGVTDPKHLIDHKDHNGLNNQKNNLRIANYKQNAINVSSKVNSSSKYLGVYLDIAKRPKYNKEYTYWRSAIRVDGKKKYLGLFKDEILAAKAYDEAAKIHHGEFANLNFK